MKNEKSVKLFFPLLLQMNGGRSSSSVAKRNKESEQVSHFTLAPFCFSRVDGCSSNIVLASTLQQARILSCIVRGGKVCSF